MPRKLKPCGTRAAYMRHYREGQRGNEIDAACREANAEYQRGKSTEADAAQHKLYAAVQWRARRDLSEMFPDEYQQLFNRYMRELRQGRAQA